MASSSFDVTYREVDFELIPSNFLGTSWPPEPIRLNVGNYVPAITMVSSFILYYFILIPYIFPATKPQNSNSIQLCQKLRDAHNAIMCLYSGLCFLLATYYLFSTNEIYSWHAILCTPVEGTWLRPLSVTFTITKIIEWLDTAFIIWLGRNPPVFLHKYHHATTFWLFCFVPNMPGPEKFGLLLNGFVHFLMYSHYYSSWPKKWVPTITILQILQLSIVTYAWTVSPNECPNAKWAPGIQQHTLEYCTPYAMVPVFLWLFILFFWRRFIQQKPKGGIKAKDKRA